MIKQTRTKNKRGARKAAAKLNRAGRGYHEAWQRFQRVNTQLSALWKTKKSSLQILRAERIR